MTLRSTLSSARRRLLCSWHRRSVALGNSGPFVSFAFDDFPRTAYTAGGAILKSLGVRGTYYVAMGLMDTSNDLGEQFHLDDLYSVAAEGHELATHTFSHQSSRRVPLGAFQEDVRRGRSAIGEIANLAATGNFAYPYGEVTLSAKAAVGREMTSCRGIYGGFNGPLVDLNLLRANSLYGDIGRFEMAEKLIQRNAVHQGWLIFYTHDVRPNTSPYGCTPELFESTARLAVRSGARVLPVAEVLQFSQIGLSPGEHDENTRKEAGAIGRPR
jgi:peptidoglycan/xylan/chitin deacetylase (PgdA/CDA1 family)